MCYELFENLEKNFLRRFLLSVRVIHHLTLQHRVKFANSCG